MKQLLVIMMVSVSLSASSQAQYDTLPNLPEQYAARRAKFKLEPIVTGKIVFAGNSFIEGGNWKKLLKDSTVINRGIYGDNTFGLLQRLDEIIRLKPSSIFLMIGIDDLSKNIPKERTIENIFTIVNRIKTGSPKTKIFVQSLLPVNPSVKNFPVQFSKQSDILEINSQLKKYGDAFKYAYVDIYQEFIEKNDLNPQFTNDGLHLNAAGYSYWVGFLKKSGLL